MSYGLPFLGRFAKVEAAKPVLPGLGVSGTADRPVKRAAVGYALRWARWFVESFDVFAYAVSETHDISLRGL